MQRQAAPTAIIADDERLMREQIVMRLKAAWPELIILGEASNGREAAALIRSQQPDIAFLDIRMPEMDGVETARAVAGLCEVVFVTAYDQYAVTAFEQGAVDYVLKPADPDRLKRTCERLQKQLQQKTSGTPPQAKLNQILEQLSAHLGTPHSPGQTPPAREYLRWVQASVGNQLRMIASSEILFFRAEDKYTRVQTEHLEALIRKPIKELVEELDPEEFWQIHRAILVRVTAIEHISRDFKGQQFVHVKGHPEKLEVSRSYHHLFKQM